MADSILCPLCRGTRTKFYAKHDRRHQSLRHCGQCGLYFAHPHVSEIPSVSHDTEDQDNFRFWGSSEAERAYGRWRAAVNSRALRRLKAHDCTGRTLEIGFGEGPLTEQLLVDVSEYWGIEPVPASFDRTVSRLGLDPRKVVCMRAEDLDKQPPFAGLKDYFDCLIFISVFEHLAEPRRILESCARLLHRGGKLLINTPDSRRFSWLRRARLLMGMEPWSHFHISFFQEKNLEQAFRDTGFAIRSKTRDRLIDPLSADYFRKLTGSRVVWLGMRAASLTALDRLLHIQTLFYVLENTGFVQGCDL